MEDESSSKPKLFSLQDIQPSLLKRDYLDQSVMEAELKALWYTHWIYVCRENKIPKPGDYSIVDIGNQRIIVTRNNEGELRAFHNTCRHRGSELCSQPLGSFKGGRIVCPYHKWSYDLDGNLKTTPFLEQDKSANLGLYPVNNVAWGGNIYINLANKPATALGENADPSFTILDNWPLSTLQLAHSHRYELACNWKIFWENYLECYHCPGIHPELCKIVPLYKQNLATDKIDPAANIPDAVAKGVESWTTDSKAVAPIFSGLSPEEITIGHTYLTLLPNQFIAAHSDYVRQVSIKPLKADTTEVICEWLFSPKAMADPAFDPQRAIDFGNLILEQDAHVCEINQRGLSALPHKHGHLAPQEQDVINFHQWYRQLMIA